MSSRRAARSRSVFAWLSGPQVVSRSLRTMLDVNASSLPLKKGTLSTAALAWCSLHTMEAHKRRGLKRARCQVFLFMRDGQVHSCLIDGQDLKTALLCACPQSTCSRSNCINRSYNESKLLIERAAHLISVIVYHFKPKKSSAPCPDPHIRPKNHPPDLGHDALGQLIEDAHLVDISRALIFVNQVVDCLVLRACSSSMPAPIHYD